MTRSTVRAGSVKAVSLLGMADAGLSGEPIVDRWRRAREGPPLPEERRAPICHSGGRRYGVTLAMVVPQLANSERVPPQVVSARNCWKVQLWLIVSVANHKSPFSSATAAL
jgi:hypothetical protein